MKAFRLTVEMDRRLLDDSTMDYVERTLRKACADVASRAMMLASSEAMEIRAEVWGERGWERRSPLATRDLTLALLNLHVVSCIIPVYRFYIDVVCCIILPHAGGPR